MNRDEGGRPPKKSHVRRGEGARAVRQMGVALAIPGMLLAGPLVGYAFGWLAVVYLHFPSWSRPVCLLLGVIAGVREAVVALKKLAREIENDSND